MHGFLMMLLNNPACVLQTKNLSAEQLTWLCLGFIAFSFPQFRVTGLVLSPGCSLPGPAALHLPKNFCVVTTTLSLWRTVFNVHSLYVFGWIRVIWGFFGFFLWVFLKKKKKKVKKKSKIILSYIILIMFYFYLLHFAKILQCFIHAI